MDDDIIGQIDSIKVRGIDYRVPKNFKEFNPLIMEEWLRTKLKKGSAGITCLIYGARGRGKTVFLRYLIHSLKRNWDEVYLFSQTADFQKDVYDFVPEENMFKEFDVDALHKLLETQCDDVKHKLKNDQERYIKHKLIIFDDVISDPRIRASPEFNSLFTTGRHYRTSSVVLSQCVGGRDGIGKAARGNTDLLVSFYPQNFIDRESIVEQFLSTKQKLIGEIVLKNITKEPFTAICVVGRIPAMEYEDYVFKMRAPEKVPKFLIGKKNSSNFLGTRPGESDYGYSFNLKFKFKIDSQHDDGYNLEEI